MSVYYLKCTALLLGLFMGFCAAAAAMKPESHNCPEPATEVTCVQQQEKPYMIKEFTIDGPGLLKVLTPAGDIEVISVPNSDKVRVELYVNRGYAFWTNTGNLDNYRITMLQRGNEVVASVEQKNKRGLFGGSISFSYKIYTPASISTELKTSAGNIRLSGVGGNQLAKSSGGNIRITNASGKVGAYTFGGNIHISSSTGVIFAQTEGGNITIEESSGEFRLRTNGGQIMSERMSGSMLAKVGGGDIRAHFLYVAEGVNLETSAGNIFLKVPSEAGYDLVLKGSDIEVPDSFYFEGLNRPNRVEGTYRQGGSPINMQTSYGTVTFETYR